MAEKLFEIQTDKIVNGTNLMYNNKELTSWSGDLSSLMNGEQMFYNCTKLNSFSSDLSSLKGGYNMFYCCLNLTSFSSDLSSLTSGTSMFSNCPLDAPSVKNIALTINKNVTNTPRFDIGVDSNIQNDEQVKKDLGLIKHKGWKLLINGSNMTTKYTLPKYAGCTDVDSIKAKDANYKTTDIVNGVWTEHLPDVVNSTNVDGDGIFNGCTTLTTFNADLSSLHVGNILFSGCTNLTTFNSNLSSLVAGVSMFSNCTKLSSFNSNLSSLTDAWYMFNGCKNLTSFNADLSSLEDGHNMFEGCTKLMTFTSKLSSLTDGTDMFANCQLSPESVQCILDSLPTVTSGTITISILPFITPTVNELKVAFAAKGWTANITKNIHGGED